MVIQEKTIEGLYKLLKKAKLEQEKEAEKTIKEAIREIEEAIKENGKMEDLLRGNCWACKRGKPYKVGGQKVRTCEHLAKGLAGSTKAKGCSFWELI